MQTNLIKNLNELRIVTYPAPVLKRKAEPIGEVTSQITALGERMIDLMIESSGIGLAGPQVGLSLRIIVVSLTGQRQDAEIFINPRLSNLNGSSKMEEGCLSLPGLHATVRRYATCTINAMDAQGSPLVMDAVDLAATVLQHETDHLNGILFIDRLNTVARMGCRRILKQLELEYTPSPNENTL